MNTPNESSLSYRGGCYDAFYCDDIKVAMELIRGVSEEKDMHSTGNTRVEIKLERKIENSHEVQGLTGCRMPMEGKKTSCRYMRMERWREKKKRKRKM